MDGSELEKKFGISEKKTLRDYVLWLESDEGKKFIVKNHTESSGRDHGNHYGCLAFKDKILLRYAKEIVTE